MAHLVEQFTKSLEDLKTHSTQYQNLQIEFSKVYMENVELKKEVEKLRSEIPPKNQNKIEIDQLKAALEAAYRNERLLEEKMEEEKRQAELRLINHENHWRRVLEKVEEEKKEIKKQIEKLKRQEMMKDVDLSHLDVCSMDKKEGYIEPEEEVEWETDDE
uniref:CC172 protein n=1 Tax=Caenorhabditis tropicalis TaxID=1561998 RepID=A0A1I7UH19_9PELO